MKVQVNLFNGWRDELYKKFPCIHWFGLTTITEPHGYFNPLIEIHAHLLNFNLRILLLKKEKQNEVGTP